MPITRSEFGGVILDSAARTVAVTNPVLENRRGRGVLLILDVTVASGTGGLTVRARAASPNDGALSGMGANPTAVTTTGKRGYLIYPVTGMYVATNLIVAQTVLALPQSWEPHVDHGDASSYTYSLAYSYLL